MLEQRFMAKVQTGPECWEWLGAKTGRGYGSIYDAGRSLYAHRVSYELACGPIPEGAEIDHLCRNKGCVNPAHLEAVSHKQNMERTPRHLFGANRHKTHCKRGHEFTSENIYWQDGRRMCRQCRSLRDGIRKARAALARARGEQP